MRRKILISALAAVFAVLLVPSAAAASAPAINSISVINVTNTSATIEAEVSPQGQSTSVQVFYGTTPNYGSAPFSQSILDPSPGYEYLTYNPLTNLLPGTTYHFQVVTINGDGTTASTDQTFTTTGTPLQISAINASLVSLSSARVSATITGTGLSAASVEYGTDTNYGQSAPLTVGPGGAYIADLSGFAPGTTIHYRISATSGAGTVTSSDQTFTTASYPQISGVSVNPAGTTAQVSMTVAPMGQDTQVAVRYGPMSNPASNNGLSTSQVTINGGLQSQSLSLTLTGLSSGAEYHFQIVADNDATGLTTTSDQTFTTSLLYDLPTVSKLTASKITDSSAVFNVDFTGDHSSACNASSQSISYGLDSSYGSTISAGLAGATCGQSSATVTGLQAGTTYHWAPTVSNPLGSTSGPDQVFTTLFKGQLTATSTHRGTLQIKGLNFRPNGAIKITLSKKLGQRKVKADASGKFVVKMKLKKPQGVVKLTAGGVGNVTVSAKWNSSKKARRH